MTKKSSVVLTVILGTMAVIIIILGCIFVVNHFAEEMFSNADVSPGSNLVKARLAEALALPMTQSPVKRGVSPPLTQAQAKLEAQSFDTYSRAYRIADSMHERELNDQPPTLSTKLPELESQTALDGWGHAFCVVASGGTVAVLSSGPAHAWSDCSGIKFSVGEIASLKSGKMYEDPFGRLILVLPRT